MWGQLGSAMLWNSARKLRRVKHPTEYTVIAIKKKVLPDDQPASLGVTADIQEVDVHIVRWVACWHK
ncbi:MAG TPA: hypothetical protein DCE41_23250 [Cytophagales bacterium]|nr:hypothetical protein [Cytophagales bacterium]